MNVVFGSEVALFGILGIHVSKSRNSVNRIQARGKFYFSETWVTPTNVYGDPIKYAGL